MDHAPGIWLFDCIKSTGNRTAYSDVTTCQHDIIVIFLTLSYLSSLNSGTSFMSISFLILEFDLKSGNWGYSRPSFIQYLSGMQNLPWMSLMKRYLMLQNARFTDFTVGKLMRKTTGRWGVWGGIYLVINFLQALSKIFAWSILEIFPQVCLINDDSNANWHLSTSFLLDLDIVYSYNKYLPRRKFVPFQESSKFTLGKRSLFTLYTNSFYSIFAYKKKFWNWKKKLR